MRTEDHLANLKESLDVIEESVEKGLVERQRTIGFSISTASVDLLEMLLHKHNLIDPGFILKHNWFNSENKIKEKLPFEFPAKTPILSLMLKLEEKRTLLCYGKPKKIELVQEALNEFNHLKKLFKEAGIDGL